MRGSSRDYSSDVTRTHVLATLLVACALAASAAPASAKQITVKDARGDVWRETDTTTATPAPSLRLGDVTKATVAHSGDRAVVKIRLARLARKGPYAQYAVKLQGNKSRVVRELLVETSRRDRSGALRVFNAHGRPVERCDADHDVDYKRDRITVRVDRGCLNKPRRIRANVNTARATADAVFYSDNLHDTAAESDAWTEWVERAR
jgi:hypothetical protein